MAVSDLETMGLDPQVVGRRVAFLESYAGSAELDISAALEGLYAARADDARLEPRAPIRGAALYDDHVWTLRMDAATAYRDAAQWAVYLDPQRANRHLSTAATHYLAAGQLYGAYLQVLSEPLEAGDVAGLALDRLVNELTFDEMVIDKEGQAGRAPLSERRRRRGAAVPPQQAAYALLAALGHERTAERRHDDLWRVASESPHGAAVTPVGSLGTPLRTIWAIGRALIEPEELRTQLIELVSALARQYEETMTRAQSSRYLWRHAASPVDVGDIELVGLAVLTARRAGQDMVEESLIPGLGPIAAAPLRAGLDLANETA